jgi:hypothetical protein
MHKKSIILVLTLFGFISYSQDIVSKIPLNLKRNLDVFQIVNDSTKAITMFFSDKEVVNAFSLNDKMKLIDSLFAERPTTKTYDFMIDNVSNTKSATLFWSSSNHKEICSQTFDFTTHTSSMQNYSITFKGEKYLQHFSEGGKFYIMSIIKDSSVLKLYVFDDGKIVEKEIDMSSFRFQNSDSKKVNFYEALGETFNPFEAPFSLQKILISRTLP